MTLNRIRLVAIVGALLAFHVQAQNSSSGAICRVVWHDDGAGGGDTRTSDADFTLPKYSPEGNRSFTVNGSTEGSVTYHSATGCPVTKGSPWKQHFDLTLSSDDGKTATMRIDPSDESHSITVACGRGAATFDVEASSVSAKEIPLKDGVATEYSARRSKGNLTFYFCKKSN